MPRPSVTSLHYNRVLTLVSVSLNGTTQPAVNVSRGGTPAPKIIEPNVTTSALEHCASVNQFMTLCEGGCENEESVGGPLSFDAVALGMAKESGAKAKMTASITAATATGGTTHSFLWPSIWIATLFVVAVLFSCMGWTDMAMDIGLGGAASLNESSASAAANVPLPQCPAWTGFGAASPLPW